MVVTLDIPDEMVERLVSKGQDPSRAVLEAWAIEGYRSGFLSPLQTRLLLGFETRYEFEGFLKGHQVWENAYDLEDLEQDRATMQQVLAEARLRV